MDAIGYLIDAIVYFVIAAGSLGVVVAHVGEKEAVAGASPWRMRRPKLLAGAGPVLFVLIFPVALAGMSAWVAVVLLIGSLLAPWVGAVLITVEWLRRRAEDRATGVARPVRPPTWT